MEINEKQLALKKMDMDEQRYVWIEKSHGNAVLQIRYL
jgi:hypothetical protein